MNEFALQTRVLTCSGAAAQVEAMHIRRLLVVSDPYFVENGTARALAQAETVEIFGEVAPDPSLALAAKGTALVQSFRPDAVLALGGGSAMDCAKAMVYFSGLTPKLIAVPTTSGSGSEVTDFAILTHEGVKHPLVDEKFRPAVAILDSELLKTMPPKLIADGGMDLISHALEAIAATGAGKISDALASDAFCTALELLPKSFAGDVSVRLDIHTAATMAGLAFSSAGLGLCHAMAHALGGEFHVPHGRLNAILLPLVVEANAPAAGAKYARLARQAALSSGADAMALRALKNALVRLRGRLQMPQSLCMAGISRTALQEKESALIAAALADPCCASNPVKPTEAMVRRILWEAAGHA